MTKAKCRVRIEAVVKRKHWHMFVSLSLLLISMLRDAGITLLCSMYPSTLLKKSGAKGRTIDKAVPAILPVLCGKKGRTS